MTNCPVTGVTNYGFNIPAFIKGGELQTVMCIFQASSITVPEVLTSQARRGTFMKDNMQVVQICKHNVMSAPGGEAAQHRGAVQGVTIQALGDSRASTETDGLCHFN